MGSHLYNYPFQKAPRLYCIKKICLIQRSRREPNLLMGKDRKSSRIDKSTMIISSYRMIFPDPRHVASYGFTTVVSAVLA